LDLFVMLSDQSVPRDREGSGAVAVDKKLASAPVLGPLSIRLRLSSVLARAVFDEWNAHPTRLLVGWRMCAPDSPRNSNTQGSTTAVVRALIRRQAGEDEVSTAGTGFLRVEPTNSCRNRHARV